MKAPIAILTLFAALLVACTATRQPEPSANIDKHVITAGEAESAWKHQAALDQGVDYLLKTQNRDGSFGSHAPRRPNSITLGSNGSLKAFHNASTALAAMGLMDLDESKTTTESARRALAWLVDCPEARRATMAIFYNTWAQIYHLQCFARAIQDPRFVDLHASMKKRAERELVILQGLQSAEGGWGYYDFRERTLHPSGRISTSFTSAAAVVALIEARDAGINVSPKVIELGLDCVERQRVPNGAYVYSHGHIMRPAGRANQIEGSLTRSQACNYALHVGKRAPSKSIKDGFMEEGLANLFQHHDYVEIARQRQNPHETWFANAPYYYYFGHFYAAEILDEIPNPTPAAATLGDLIAKTQDSDGSFWDYSLYGYTKAYGTAYGVLILNRCKRHLEKAPKSTLASTPWFRKKATVETKTPKGFQLASAEWRHEDSLDRAVDYVVKHQHKNGQFGSAKSSRSRDLYLGGSNSLHAFGQASHALAWMGLQCVEPSEAINAALDRGLEFMLEAPRTGRVHNATFYHVWSTCYVPQALSIAIKDPRFAKHTKRIKARAAREFQSLLVLQGADGGFGYFDFKEQLGPPSGKGTTPMNVAVALETMRCVEEMGISVPKVAKKAALECLEEMRLPSGAFIYGRAHLYYPHGRANQIEGSLGRSQAGNLPLFNAGRLKKADLKKSLNALFQHHDYIEIARQRQMPHETWFANAPYYYYYGHFYASEVIAKLDTKDQGPYIATLADFVAKTQDTDGSFWDYPLYDFERAYGGGYAIMTLQKAKSLLTKAAQPSTVTSAK